VTIVGNLQRLKSAWRRYEQPVLAPELSASGNRSGQFFFIELSQKPKFHRTDPIIGRFAMGIAE
jgi:hypothetical protein